MAGGEIKLGDRVVDKVTGVKGVVTAIASYLHGEPQIRIEWYVLNTDTHHTKWMSTDRFEIVD